MSTGLKRLSALGLALSLLVVGTVSCGSLTGGEMTGGAMTGMTGDTYNQNISGSEWVYGQNRHDPHAMDYD